VLKRDPNVQITYTNGYQAWLQPQTQYSYDRTGDASKNTTIDTYYDYVWFDSAKQSTIRVQASNQDAPGWAPGLSAFEYDSFGRLKAAYDVDGGRGFAYQTDGEGRILQRDELLGTYNEQTGRIDNATSNRWHAYYYLDDRQIGNVGNDGIERIDYAQELAQRAQNNSNKDQDHKRFRPVAGADFDGNYLPINSLYPTAAPGSYIVHAGDTLTSIAMALWGDSSLWWLLADANGLSLNEPLIPNTVLTVPNKVTNLHNNSSTFKPYDAGKAIGNTNPTIPDAPPPPQPKGGKGCGGVLQIVAIAVAVVATIYTAGAASAVLGTIGSGALGGAVGAVASQAVLIAGGAQSGFDWKGVAMGAVGGAVTAGVSGGAIGKALTTGNSFTTGLVQGAVSSTVSSAIGSVAGMGSFNWKNIAASAASSGASRGVSQNLPGAATEASKATWGNTLASTFAGGAASAAVYGNFSQQSLTGITMNAIASTIGNSVANQMASKSPAKAANSTPTTNTTQANSSDEFLFGANYGAWNPYADIASNSTPSSTSGSMVLGKPLGMLPDTASLPNSISLTDFTRNTFNVTDFTYVGESNGRSQYLSPTVTVTPSDGYTPYYDDLASWATQYNRPLPPLTRDPQALDTYYAQQYAQTAPSYGQWSRDANLGQMSPLQRSQYLYQEAYSKLTSEQRNAVFEQNFKAWRDADTKSFLSFNAQIAFMGATAGLSAGVPFLAAASAARGSGTVSTALGYALATRAGTGAISGAIDAGAQLMSGEPFKWTNVVISTATGALGVGGGIRWNMAINVSAGFVQTGLNNQIYGTNDNVFVGAVTSGVAAGVGYGVGSLIANGLSSAPLSRILIANGLASRELSKTLVPVIGGNTASPIAYELTGASLNPSSPQDPNPRKKP